MNSSITRRVGFGLALAVLSASGVAFLAVRTSELLLTSTAEVEHTHTVLEAISDVRLTVARVRTAARSYAIIGDTTQSEPFRLSRSLLRSRIDSLSLLVQDHPQQRARLDSLAIPLQVLLADWDAAVASPPGNPVQMSRSYQRIPQRRAELDQLDRLFVAMDAAERELLDARARANDAYVRQTRWILAGSVGLTILILAGTFGLFRRHLRERDLAEKERVRLQGFLDSIIENIPLMIFVKEAGSLRFARFNRAGEELVGCSRDDLLGRSDYDLFPREQADFFTAKDRETLKGDRKLVIEEEPISTVARGTRLLRTHKMAIRSPEGTPEYLVGISEDITDRVRTEEQLRAVNRVLTERSTALEAANRDLEGFSYSVSHDLRGPVRAIEGFSRILLEEHAPALDPEVIRLLEVVRGNARRMGQMIDDLLRLSRVGRQELKRDRIDMAAMVRSQVAELSQGEPERAVEVQVDPLPPAMGDPGLVEQVTANLLGNAWKFTRRSPGARIRIKGRCQGLEAEYVVSDNGAGFDMRYADKLFGVFQRLHRPEDYEGTGVGLAVAQRIVERHGGRIWAESTPGEGAAFHFTLPHAEDAA
jgi:PAS domain S-box-containing protein